MRSSPQDRVKELDEQARVSLPLMDPSISPHDYFKHGADCLRRAGEFKQSNDYEMAYLYLMKYFCLVTESIPSHPNLSDHIDEFHYNCEKCAGRVNTELQELREFISKKKRQDSSSRLSPVATTTTTTAQVKKQQQNKKALPVPPSHHHQKVNNMMSSANKIASPAPYPSVDASVDRKTKPNPPLQQQQQNQPLQQQQQQQFISGAIGTGIAHMANNEQVQSVIGSGISNAAQNRQYQKSMGHVIAQNTDNYLLKTMAQNETAQRHLGSAISKTAGNKEVQKKMATAVANAATNKEVQQKVMNGVSGAAKLGWGAAKAGGTHLMSNSTVPKVAPDSSSSNKKSLSDWWM